jgi:hypothetical protein
MSLFIASNKDLLLFHGNGFISFQNGINYEGKIDYGKAENVNAIKDKNNKSIGNDILIRFDLKYKNFEYCN